MIKFFRKIRQNLLNQGKTSKYFKYAIGEIVLVVIGILIALQINNWNEERKDTSFELKMLKEIQINLQKDLSRNTYLLEERINQKKEGLINVMEIINSNKIVEDSVANKKFNMALKSVVFNYDDGAYQAIKSIGLDKVSNDSLRNKMVRFFDHNLPLTKIFLTNYNYEKRKELRDKTVTLKYKKGKYWYTKSEITLETLKSNPNVIKLLDIESTIYFNYDKRIRSVIKDYNDIIESVANEIKRLEND